MIRRLPSEKTRRWTGPYLGSYFGSVWMTKNIDLDREEGKVSLSRRLTQVADTTDTNTDTLGSVSAFLRSNAGGFDAYWGLSRKARLYRIRASTFDSWDLDTIANSPSVGVDMWVHENDSDSANGDNIMFVTSDTDIAALNDTAANTWNQNWWVTTKSQTALDSDEPHYGDYFPVTRISLVLDGHKIHTIDKSKAVTYGRLILPPEYRAEFAFSTARREWILCSHRFGGNGAIIEWDGFSTTYNNVHNLYSQFPISGVNFQEVPIVLNHEGLILEYTGSGFVPMVRNGEEVSLPLVEQEGFALSTVSTPVTRPGRCMTVAGDGLIYMHLNVATEAAFSGDPIRQMAGIWCLNPLTGRLYNKYLLVDSVNDFGHQNIGSNGAIYPIDPNTFSGATFLIGGSYNASVSAVKSAIWTLQSVTSVSVNRGHFLTPYIPADEIREFWDLLWIHFRQFFSSANRILVKARGTRSLQMSNGLPIDVAATWVNTTSFTAQLNSASDDAIQVGDEIEVLYGDNAGLIAHVTQISGAHAALQTFTIDETTPTSSSNTFLVRFDRWKKVGTISSTTVQEQFMNIGIDSSFIQFKIELRGPSRELQISDMIIKSKESLKI